MTSLSSTTILLVPEDLTTAMANLDDYVADSEEEISMDIGIVNAISNWNAENVTREMQEQRAQKGAQERSTLNHQSSISDFTAQPTGGGASTSISTFTTPAAKPPRPRPRPKKKVQEGVVAESSDISSFSLLDRPNDKPSPARDDVSTFNGEFTDFPMMSSIADRAKTRQRKISEPFAAQNWEDDDFDIPQPSKKNKSPLPKPGAATGESSGRTTTKGKANMSDEVIELTSDEDELNLPKKSMKPKPKPKPKPKAPSPVPVDAHTSTDSAPKLPRPKPHPKVKKPQMPSDAQTSEANSKRASTPLIPPPTTDLVSSHPNNVLRPAIPSSLPPSDPPLPTSQGSIATTGLPPITVLPGVSASSGRRRSSEVDELFSGDDDLFGPDPDAQGNPKALPPPPTFFAGSSSLETPTRGDTHDARQDELDSIYPAPATTKSKRKKKALDDDDDDADWGAGPSKPKENPKKKNKAKEETTFAQVEVVIETTPESVLKAAKAKQKEKRKEKGKDKGKEKEKEKDVFKSREIIEDSDEDPLLAMYGPDETAGAGSSSRASGTVVPPVTSDPVRQDDHMDEDEDVPVVSKSARKKRKAMTVEDDDEDFGEEPAPVEKSAGKRRKKDKEAGGEEAQGSKKKKGKARVAVVLSEEEAEEEPKTVAPVEEEEVEVAEENVDPVPEVPAKSTEPAVETPQPPKRPRHSLTSRIKSTPMSELIKRVNSLPNSPFPVVPSSARVPAMSRMATSYSPYIKSSKSLLSKIAPLHPNRRTPPPPLPPPPPKRKTKKEIEREERWEEEIIDSVGIEAWAAMSDLERRDMRKAKMEAEMGGWD